MPGLGQRLRIVGSGTSLMAWFALILIAVFLMLSASTLFNGLAASWLFMLLVLICAWLSRPKPAALELYTQNRQWQLKAHGQEAGVVTRVENYGLAWMIESSLSGRHARHIVFKDQLGREARRRMRMIYQLMELKKQRLW